MDQVSRKRSVAKRPPSARTIMLARCVLVLGWIYVLPGVILSLTAGGYSRANSGWTMVALMAAPCFVVSFLNGRTIVRNLAVLGGIILLLVMSRALVRLL